MNRLEAIETIAERLDDEFIISCNGMISRELFHIKERSRNFYMLGSMGLAPAIGLGVALAKPDRKVICLVGDGNMLMSLGTLATIGKVSPENLIIIVLDNECHESTGGQETASSVTMLEKIAYYSGFRSVQHVDSKRELKCVFKKFLGMKGPSFIHVKIDREKIKVPRVSIKPAEIKRRFMKELMED